MPCHDAEEPDKGVRTIFILKLANKPSVPGMIIHRRNDLSKPFLTVADNACRQAFRRDG